MEFNHQQIPLSPGQFITSREHAARDLGYGSKTFDRKIDDLLKLKILTRLTTRRFSIISIINWEAYQSKARKDDPLLDPLNDPLPDHRQEERIKKKTLRDSPNPAVKVFIDYFVQLVKEKTGAPYSVNEGKDGKLVKNLLRDHPLDRLKELARSFFRSRDPFIEKSGFTIGVFSSQINTLAQKISRRDPQEGRTDDFLEKLEQAQAQTGEVDVSQYRPDSLFGGKA